MKSTLFFMHVPRTGGAALTGVLENRFAASDCLELHHGPEPDLSDIGRFRYIAGHLDRSFLERFDRPPFVLTVLRDPIDRALSTYSLTRSFPPGYEAPPGLRLGPGAGKRALFEEWWRLARECDLRELISRSPEAARQIIGNRQARALTASSPGEEQLDVALEALDRCDFVGLTERLDESLTWLTRRLGWRDLHPLPRHNVSGPRLGREDVDAGTIEAVARLTEVDRELYRRGVERFERQLAEWSALRDPRDSSVEIPDASPVSDLSFDQPIAGGGWMNRERAEDGDTFCWIGDTRRAWAEMIAGRRAKQLVIEIPHVVDQEVLKGLRVSIAGRTIPHTLSESDGVILATTPLPGSRLRRRTMIVSIELERSRHARDVNPDSIDNRELAIAVRRIAMRPA
jgi:hypothetical protein